MRLHIATSRPHEIGNRCIDWAKDQGFVLAEMSECDVFISILYDKLLEKEYIDSHRCYNFHPGILPYYRGSGVYSWVLINGESETGVTLHEIDYNIDSGPIIEVRKTLIGEYDTAETLFTRCMDILFSMFVHNLAAIICKTYKTSANEGGKLYLREHLDKVKDISKLIRGLTFGSKETAYWVDSEGNKRNIHWS